jgi:hypothetical protein
MKTSMADEHWRIDWRRPLHGAGYQWVLAAHLLMPRGSTEAEALDHCRAIAPVYRDATLRGTRV